MPMTPLPTPPTTTPTKPERTRKVSTLLVALVCAALAACAPLPERKPAAFYDLAGPAAGAVGSARASGPANGPRMLIAVTEVSAPAWMEDTRLRYRLLYDDPLQLRTYAQARWSGGPSRLLLQRVKSQLSGLGVDVLSGVDASPSIAQLRIEVDDFTQAFTAPDASRARVALRASVLQERKLVAQRSFEASRPAGADAGSGVNALSEATTEVVDEMQKWLSTLPIKR